MRLQKYLCETCGTIFITDSTRHTPKYCPGCEKSMVDLEECYCRGMGNLTFIEEFLPDWFDDEENYHSALLGWLNDSDEKYELDKSGDVLYIITAI